MDSTVPDEPSDSAIRRIDEICSPFDRRWRAGERGSVEQCLAALHLESIPEPERSSLVRELLRVELERRLEAGERVDPGELARRFPTLVDIDKAWPPSAEFPRPGALTSPPPRLAERYALLTAEPAAEGGLGRIFRARDAEFDRDVALKEIQPRLADDPRARARFKREARVIGLLQHPGIVPIHSQGEDRFGRPYYVMRFIEGNDLQWTIDDARARDNGGVEDWNGRLRPLLARFVTVCETVAYAHSRGVVHRDLKPANIMLGPFGETLVVDWGLAKARGIADAGFEPVAPAADGARDDETSIGLELGTPLFMSPEQAEGRLDDIGPTSDVYGLGATLYCVLTGSPPFSGGSRADVLARVKTGDFPPPRQLDRRIPPALQAIVLKAMATDRKARYPTASKLARDIERWLNDEPVEAWREPARLRAARVLRRRKTAAAALLASVLASLLAIVGYGSMRLAEARARVDQLMTAEMGSVPAVLAELGGDRFLVRGRLRALADFGDNLPLRVRGALALLADEPERADFLVRRALDPKTTPDELLTIRDELARSGGRERGSRLLAAELGEIESDVTDSQLRALGALVAMEPEAGSWADRARPIAAKLVEENPLTLEAWRRVFQPIARHLIGPLQEIHADFGQPRPRNLAHSLLLSFANRPDNADRPVEVAALLADADPGQARSILESITAESAIDPRVVSALDARLRPIARFDAGAAARQGRVGAILARLGRADLAWPLFEFRDDPSARAAVIREFPRYQVAVETILARIERERDVPSLRALVLCLGGYEVDAIPPARRAALIDRFEEMYRTHPDPGLHGALAWLLGQRWGRAEALAAIDRRLAATAPGPVDSRDWFLNAEGQTFAVVKDPGSFLMGSSPDLDAERQEDESRHGMRIPRSFAIAAREVTFADYRRYLAANPPSDPAGANLADWRANPQIREVVQSDDAALCAVTWFEAAAYCNWLSRRDGLPPEQWCYEEIGPKMLLPEDHLERRGYRLPTEAEWERACRAGTVSSRPYGNSPALLGEYGWYMDNSGNAMRPVGELKPNDLGLFDMLGNAHEWCGSRYVEYDKQPGFPDLVLDSMANLGREIDDLDSIDQRVLRGGMFDGQAAGSRSAFRNMLNPSRGVLVVGFRPCRTVDAEQPAEKNVPRAAR